MRKLIILVGVLMMFTLIQVPAQRPQELPDYKTQSVHFDSYVTAYEKWLSEEEKSNSVNAQSRLFKKRSKQFYRWVWYQKNRLNIAGYTFNSHWETLKAYEDHRAGVANARALPGGDWVNVGPTSVFTFAPSLQLGIGRVNCLAFDNTGGYIFAGSAAGGAWKRPASGGTWICITNSIPNLSVSSICLNPANPNDIFLLTGDGNANHNSSIGVIKSTDGGNSWSTTGLTWTSESNIGGYKMLRSPASPSTLIVASTIGILKSSDGGNTWINAQAGVFFDIEFKPGQPSTMYATSADGFWLSTTSGNTWTQITIPGIAGMGAQRSAVAVSAANPSVVYFAAGKDPLPGFVGIWKSSSSGATGSWGSGPVSSAATTADVFVDGTNSYSQATYDFALAVNPSNVNEIFIGGIDTYRSTNGGVSFNRESSYYQAGNDNMHADQHAFEYDGAGTMWVGNDAGVYKYTPSNPTSKWTQEYNGLAITQYYGIGLDRDANIFGNYEANYLGTQDNGQHRYDGDANNEIVYFGDGGDAVVDFTNDNTYYFNGNARLYKSCWPTPCDKTPPVTTCGCADASYNLNGVSPDRPIVIDPSNNNIIYHGIRCLWRSTNGADNWSLYPGFNCVDGGAITGIQIGAGYKWVSKGTKVYRETAPNVWSDVTANLSSIFTAYPGIRLTDIAVNPTNPSEAWVSFSGYEESYKVFYTSTAGANWSNWGYGIPDVPVNCLVYQNGTNGGVYAGTDIGVYYTNNTLPEFIPFTNGMPAVIITDLDINPGQGLLYATTFGRGLWTSSLAGNCPADENTSNFASLPGNSLLQASNSIISSQVFNSGYGQTLAFEAGNFVQLNPGFEAVNGTVLTSSISSCSNVARPVADYDNGVLVLDVQSLTAGSSGKSINVAAVAALQLHPNPVSDQVTIQADDLPEGNLQMQIVDVSGRSVMDIQTNQEIRGGSYRIPLSVGHLPSGTYLVKMITENGIISKPFVKL